MSREARKKLSGRCGSNKEQSQILERNRHERSGGRDEEGKNELRQVMLPFQTADETPQASNRKAAPGNPGGKEVLRQVDANKTRSNDEPQEPDETHTSNQPRSSFSRRFSRSSSPDAHPVASPASTSRASQVWRTAAQ